MKICNPWLPENHFGAHKLVLLSRFRLPCEIWHCWCQRYITAYIHITCVGMYAVAILRLAEKVCCTPTFSTLLRGNFIKMSLLRSIRGDAHKVFGRYLDFLQFRP